MKRRIRPELLFYFAAIAATALALGLTDSIFANYFNDAYHITAVQRGNLEMPRELPGVLCVFIMASLSFMGDVRQNALAQLFSMAGILVLGIFTPSYNWMVFFIFINSIGAHMVMPLQESIGMSLAEPQQVGKRLGQYTAFRTGVALITNVLVIIGFRAGFFSFLTPIKLPFVLAAGLYLVSFFLYLAMARHTDATAPRRKVQMVFKKRYKYYYVLSIVRGFQKQINFVFAPWLLIEFLGQKADTTATLALLVSISGVIIYPFLGRWIDRFGTRRLFMVEGIAFILIYISYALVSAGIVGGVFSTIWVPVALVGGLFVLDRCAMSLGLTRSVYVKSIAPDPKEITPVLATGLSLDHIVSILVAMAGGYVWAVWGPQYLFLFVAVLSVPSLVVAFLMGKEEKNLPQAENV